MNLCADVLQVTYIDRKGVRVTAESSYLKPNVLQRPNLTVSTRAQVTRVLFDTTNGRKRAVGVEFATSRDSPRYKLSARKEVILS